MKLQPKSKFRILDDYLLPNLICIGTMRSGTTWLYNVLKAHPDIYLCSFRKETHFFTFNYNKGLDWYKQFFPKVEKIKDYKIIAEIAATYSFQENCAERVFRHFPDIKLMIMLRNPVDRLISDYKYEKLKLNIQHSFKEFMSEKTYSFKRGLYAQQLKNWIKIFPKDQLQILIFEEVMRNKSNTIKRISDFLNIDPKKFNFSILSNKINPSKKPRFYPLYLLASKINGVLVKNDLFKLSYFAKKTHPLFYAFGDSKKEDKTLINKEQIYLKYQEDIKELEKIIGYPLDIWKP